MVAWINIPLSIVFLICLPNVVIFSNWGMMSLGGKIMSLGSTYLSVFAEILAIQIGLGVARAKEAEASRIERERSQGLETNEKTLVKKGPGEEAQRIILL